jgi:uncharacterized protein (DUF924 family)
MRPSPADAAAIEQILRFWFEELTPEDWFKVDEARDAGIGRRFRHIYEQLAAGVPPDWLTGPDGFLAAILVLDQFPRNIFRGTPRAFATDAAALDLAKLAIAEGIDLRVPPERRAFIYMPFQHAENRADQARSVELFTALGNRLNLDFAIRHKQVVDRFGRFPHRNAILGRETTEEEAAFLKEPGSSF